jgi:hypothetical protein
MELSNLSANPEEIIPEEAVAGILDIYLPEYQYVTGVSVRDLTMKCKLRTNPYPFTNRRVFQYITSATAALMVSQLTYVLIGSLVILRYPPLLAFFGDLQKFRMARDDAKLMFGRLEFRFGARVTNSKQIRASIQLSRSCVLNGELHCMLGFHIGDGITGSIHALTDSISQPQDRCTERTITSEKVDHYTVDYVRKSWDIRRFMTTRSGSND